MTPFSEQVQEIMSYDVLTRHCLLEVQEILLLTGVCQFLAIPLRYARCADQYAGPDVVCMVT